MILVTGGALHRLEFRAFDAQRRDEPIVNLDKLTCGEPEQPGAVARRCAHIFVQGDICDRGLVRNCRDTSQERSCTSRPRATSTAPFRARRRSSRPTLPGPFASSGSPLIFARHPIPACLLGRGLRLLRPDDPPSPRTLRTRRTARMQRPRPRQTTWCGPTTKPTACRRDHELLEQLWPPPVSRKLIPLTIANALSGKPLPVYGDGRNVRDWLYVEDHCEAVRLVLERGRR